MSDRQRAIDALTRKMMDTRGLRQELDDWDTDIREAALGRFCAAVASALGITFDADGNARYPCKYCGDPQPPSRAGCQCWNDE